MATETGMVSGNIARQKRARPRPASQSDDAWLRTVAQAASRAAGGVPVELLGEYLPLLADAAAYGRRPSRQELQAVRLLGRRAAEMDVSAGRVVDLYLSAAWRLWRELPVVVRSRDSEVVRGAAEAVLHVVDDAVATLAEGYTEARRQLIRWEETTRRELIDDLLRGDADVGGLAERAEPFGIDLAQSHQVALAAPSKRLPDIEAAMRTIERLIIDRLGDREVLVAAKDGLLVVLAPATGDHSTQRTRQSDDIWHLMHARLSRLPRGRPWQVAIGRPYAGAYGIARSYEEARDGLTMAARLNLDKPVIPAEDLLIYRVLARDQPAIVDLVHAVLTPLTKARGGAQPLLDTLNAYFVTGGVATEAARQLHLSVRAVTYRLDRIRQLTGHDPTDPAHQFTLQAAVLGARLLGWPRLDLPTTS
jgi:sugar diacid utilization regulator